MSETLTQPQFSGFAGIGWKWVNISDLHGGLILLKLRIIRWHIPMAMLAGLVFTALLAELLHREQPRPHDPSTRRNHDGRIFYRDRPCQCQHDG